MPELNYKKGDIVRARETRKGNSAAEIILAGRVYEVLKIEHCPVLVGDENTEAGWESKLFDLVYRPPAPTLEEVIQQRFGYEEVGSALSLAKWIRESGCEL